MLLSPLNPTFPPLGASPSLVRALTTRGACNVDGLRRLLSLTPARAALELGLGTAPGQGLGGAPGQGLGTAPGQGLGGAPGQGLGGASGQGLGGLPAQVHNISSTVLPLLYPAKC